MTDTAHRTTRLDLNRLSADPIWPTKRQDRQAAVTILQRHAADGEPLRLLDDWGEATDGERLWVRFPEWLRELASHLPGLCYPGVGASPRSAKSRWAFRASP